MYVSDVVSLSIHRPAIIVVVVFDIVNPFPLAFAITHCPSQYVVDLFICYCTSSMRATDAIAAILWLAYYHIYIYIYV